MFEVGKFYKCNVPSSSPYIIEILCVGKEGSYARVVESPHGVSPKESEFKLHIQSYGNWEEYTPLKKYCIDIYVGDGVKEGPVSYIRGFETSLKTTHHKPSSPWYKHIKTIEVEL
jgi:hypothetical protein